MRKPKTRTKQLRVKFDAVHVKGMKALRQHDYATLGDAIAEERNILQAQADLIEEQRKTAAALSRRVSAIIPSMRKKKAKKVRNAKRAAKKR